MISVGVLRLPSLAGSNLET
jgi:hypothetical protein